MFVFAVFPIVDLNNMLNSRSNFRDTRIRFGKNSMLLSLDNTQVWKVQSECNNRKAFWVLNAKVRRRFCNIEHIYSSRLLPCIGTYPESVLGSDFLKVSQTHRLANACLGCVPGKMDPRTNASVLARKAAARKVVPLYHFWRPNIRFNTNFSDA